MKKLLSLAAVAALSLSVCAQDFEEAEGADEFGLPEFGAPSEKAPYWPAFFAVHELPETPDLVGIRLTIPYSTKQESVTGIDLGFWGRALYFEGLQLSLLRNDAKDHLSGIQCGLYNTTARADLFGIQIGAWNEAVNIRGAQAGLVNLAGHMEGFQFGLINRAESLYGFQFGLINVIRDAVVPFFPLVNIGF